MGMPQSSVTVVMDERRGFHALRAQGISAAELGQVNHEERAIHRRACLAKQARAGQRSTAGGDEIVDEEDALALIDCARIHLQPRAAVFEFIIDADSLNGQLARLAQRDEAHA